MNQLFSPNQLTKIGTLIYLGFISLMILCFQHHIIAIISCAVLNLMLPLLSKYLVNYRRRKFEKLSLTYLREIRLQIKLGKAFREALKQSRQTFEDVFAIKVARQLEEIVAFSQQAKAFHEWPFADQLSKEFIIIHNHPHTGLNRIGHIVEKLHSISEFRHKSGQVTAQLQIQAIILVGLYFALLTFTLFNFEWKEIKTMVLISIALFSLGTYGTFKWGRRMKWKI